MPMRGATRWDPHGLVWFLAIVLVSGDLLGWSGMSVPRGRRGTRIWREKGFRCGDS
jgi:hypothetical protein